jgi:uncharacterized protein
MIKKKYVVSSFFALLTLVILAAIFVVENVLPYSSIKPMKRQSTTTPTDYGLDYEPFMVKNDSVSIADYYIPNDTAKATLICIHGITNFKETFLAYSKELHQIGYNVVLVDLRAHGKSSGAYCTFGYYEKHDLQKVIDFAFSKSAVRNIGIHGHSLGGAVALQTLALDNRLKFGIIESTFTTYEDVMLAYAGRLMGFKNRALVQHIVAKSAHIAHFEADKIKPIDCCQAITVPIFMEHGTADNRIPFEMGQQNFAALASKDKIFYAIENGDHVNVHGDGGEKYWAALKDFLRKRF